MGANQSHTESDDSDSSGSSDSSMEKTSYLEDYPNPLGHFKSVHVIKDVDRIIATHTESTHRSKRFRKMNIAFSHQISVLNPDAFLYVFVACKVNNSFWKVRANVTVKVRNFNDQRDSIIHYCGVLDFSSYNSATQALQRRTSISLIDFIYEDSKFVRNNEMIVEVDVRVVEVEGFYQPLVINYRLAPIHSKNWFRIFHPNVIFYCNKAILKAFVKSGSHRMNFKQPSSGSFEELLDSVYGFPIPISNPNSVRNLLKYAIASNMSDVIQRVGTTIIHRSKINHSCRKIAVRFNLRRVMHAWLNKKKSIKKKDVEDLDVEKMSGEVMKAIVKRVLEVGWKMEDESEEEKLMMSELFLWGSYKK
ncbi:hypothetical protein GCK72_012118 [Caenorhabditis remanei]|uniref:BTB domain-containing protein n=1 Tax=Caenorhabditis remanei TaxID=31234 RepID=A0A6A5GK60_CAERE|nr:hypothetical protein GCK72_012118 [Caenorhabditis remanei]KAF1755668.1 hypothetical protein GCK72_012118 [Caenorhabditis remanei]